MEYIRNFNSFKKQQRVYEEIFYGRSTIKAIVEPQIKKALDSFPEKITVSSVLKWIRATLLNTKTESFFISPPLEELKATGGAGGKVLPKNYHGIVSTVEPQTWDYADLSYYRFMEIIFSPETGLFSDPADNRQTKTMGFKIENKDAPLYLIEQACLKKFEKNALPFATIKYCFKRIRAQVAKEIKFIPDEKSRKALTIVTFDDVNKDKAAGAGPGSTNKSTPGNTPVKSSEKVTGGVNTNVSGGTQSGDDSGKIAQGLFIDETATNHIPDLKTLLIKVGLRERQKNPAETEKVKKILCVKKREAFYKYFKETIYPKFEKAISSIKEKEVEEYLKKVNIDIDSGKQTYNEGDDVVYLKKDKTIKDWNNLKDYQKGNMEDEDTKKVAGGGKVVAVEEDGNYKIEYAPEKFAIKSGDEILKKIDKPTEKEEEDKEKEEGDKEKEEGLKEPKEESPKVEGPKEESPKEEKKEQT